MATSALDVLDLSDDHAHLTVDRLPRAARPLGCRTCGLPAQEHGRTVIHRFARPDLPPGYRYLDEVGVGDDLALRRRPAAQSTIVVAQLPPAPPPDDDGLLWLRTARGDCALQDPAAIVGAVRAA